MRLVINQPPGSTPGEVPPRIVELVYDPAHPVLRIGRHTSNDIVISDPSVSRHHSEIQVRPDGLIVRDLGSSNGTFINQQRLKPDVPAFIAVGQELGIGNVVTALADSPLKVQPPTASPSAYDPLNEFFDQTEPPDFTPPARPVARPVASAPVRPPSPTYDDFEYPARTSPPAARNARSNTKAASGPNWFIVGILIGVLLLGLGILGFVVWQTFSTSTTSNIVALPSNVFASPANSEKVLGITLAHPSAWQRREGTNVVGFSPPGSDSTVITLEKPPGPTILDPRLSPEVALRQYTANVRANSQNFRVLQEPALTRLKDGTPAWFSRVVFTTTGAPVVTDYTVNVLTFKCGDTLYFASTGAEGKNYNGATRQDLEAAVANFQC